MNPSYISPVQRFSVAEQTVDHLRGGIASGLWGGRLPATRKLAKEFDVSPNTLRLAVKKLEKEGILKITGKGRARRILICAGAPAAKVRVKAKLRIGILLEEPLDQTAGPKQGALLTLRHRIDAAGHTVVIPPKTLSDAGMDTDRVMQMVEATPADAWIVVEGNRALLDRFSARGGPFLAFCGNIIGSPIAGVGADSREALREGLKRLVEAGHRRIVFVTPARWRLPAPVRIVSTFLEELSAAGIAAGPYNTPDWVETPDGFRKLLESLFRLTPPTALILADYDQVVGALSFFAGKGIEIPKDLSMISMQDDATLRWIRPELTHFERNFTPMLRQIMKWVGGVSRGESPTSQLLTASVFVPGRTIAKAPKK